MWPGGFGLQHGAPSAGWVTAYGLTIGTIEAVALAFGSLWIVLNVYQYYPIAQAFVENVLWGPSGADEARVAEADLPRIDVLLPAYREGTVIEQAIASVRDANYPQDRIDLFVVVEPGDDDTRSVLRRLDGFRFTELVVPAAYPGDPNKPRALNYAFEHTDGDVVGIVDAEDVVDPNLFREAATEIAAGRDFVQARLDMVNEDAGWLNTMFRAEYGFWYEIVLPAFEAVGYPIPLSGTSCLFRRSLLIVANVERRARYGDGIPRDGRLWTGAYRLFGWTPWDPDNVTEDFELGLFLWERGFDVGYLEATTAEESPLSLDGWMKQRTRWKKGKLQTFRKFLRSPPHGAGAKAHLFWQSFLPHLGPINLAGVVFLVGLANLARYDPGVIVGAVLSLGLAFVVVSTALFGVGYWLASDAPRPVRGRRLATLALTLPFYWFLQWVADVRALEQAHRGWFGWERVEHHGLDVVRGGATALETRRPAVLAPNVRLVALAGIVLLGASLRLVHLDAMSLWADELYAIAVRSEMPLSASLSVSNDPHPPTYYALLHAWMGAFGESAASARALSAVLSIATIPALYSLGRELFDDRVGLVAALLLAVSTYHVHFGRTARMYSLFGLLTVGSWLFFTRLRSGSTADVAGYLLASAALLYVHAFGILVLLAQHGFVLLSETGGGIPRDRWRAVQTGLGVLVAPVLAYYLWRVATLVLNHPQHTLIDWIPIPSTVAVAQTLSSYVGYPVHYPVLGGSTTSWIVASAVLLLALCTSVLSVLTYTSGTGYQLTASWRTGQSAMLFAVPIVVPFVASYAFAPVYAPRYTLPASIGLYLLVGAGIASVPDRRVAGAILLALLAGSAPLVGAYFATATVEDWRTAGDSIEADARPGDVLVLQPGWIEPYVEYYYDGPRLAPIPVEGGRLPDRERTELAERVERADRVWLVSYQDEPSPSLLSVLSDRRRVPVYRRGALYVYRYESATPAGSACCLNAG